VEKIVIEKLPTTRADGMRLGDGSRSGRDRLLSVPQAAERLGLKPGAREGVDRSPPAPGYAPGSKGSDLIGRRRGRLSEKPGPNPEVGLNELLDHGLYILHALLQALLQVGLSVDILFHDRARRGFLKECIEQRGTSLHFPKSRVVQFVLG
jgi:hypothetical protein